MDYAFTRSLIVKSVNVIIGIVNRYKNLQTEMGRDSRQSSIACYIFIALLFGEPTKRIEHNQLDYCSPYRCAQLRRNPYGIIIKKGANIQRKYILILYNIITYINNLSLTGFSTHLRRLDYWTGYY